MALTFGIFCPIHSGGFDKRETAGVQDPTWAEARRVTLRAEELGFAYNLVAARWYGPVLEPYTTTAALASITSRIHLITAVHSGLVQPQLVAKMGANIDQISGGRFHINLVSGSEDHQFQHVMYGGTWLEHDERYVLSEEYIRQIKGMWSQQPYSDEGRYYQLADVDLQPKPVQRPVPTTFLGGSSEPAREVAAKECDWFFISFLEWDDILALKADMEQRAARHGRRLRFAISAMTMVRDTDAEAEAEIAALTEQAQTDRTVRVFVGALKAGLYGTPERIAERLNAFSRAGFEMSLFQSRDMSEDLERFAEQVVPLLDAPASGAEGPGYLSVG
jgi:dimethylsulfone monooxygenase